MVVRTNIKITRGELINKLTHEHCQFFPSQPIFVETGSGISTLDLAEAGKKFNAKVYSCDRNQEKINQLIARTRGKLDNVEILVGDSLENLAKIAEKHSQIHFAHLDGAVSAF
jgi:predicted O-methyltransferase YrrM